MIDKLLTELDALHAAATEGEWSASEPYAGFAEIRVGKLLVFAVANPDSKLGDADLPTEQKYANLRLIPAAHNHYPALAAEIRRLREELATAERRGAAAELRRLADEVAAGIDGWYTITAEEIRERVAKLEASNG